MMAEKRLRFAIRFDMELKATDEAQKLSVAEQCLLIKKSIEEENGLNVNVSYIGEVL
jgi:hypothetical protein